jgi:hypothetical protein
MLPLLRNRDPMLFDPGIRDGKKSGSGMNIPDHFSESLETVFWIKNTLFYFFEADPAPGSF